MSWSWPFGHDKDRWLPAALLAPSFGPLQYPPARPPSRREFVSAQFHETCCRFQEIFLTPQIETRVSSSFPTLANAQRFRCASCSRPLAFQFQRPSLRNSGLFELRRCSISTHWTPFGCSAIGWGNLLLFSIKRTSFNRTFSFVVFS